MLESTTLNTRGVVFFKMYFLLVKLYDSLLNKSTTIGTMCAACDMSICLKNDLIRHGLIESCLYLPVLHLRID